MQDHVFIAWWDPVILQKATYFSKKTQAHVKNVYMVCLFYHSRRLTKDIKQK